MNIEDLTIKQARELAALFSASQIPQSHSMAGKYVVIRTYSAGVHIGVLKSAAGKEVVLSDARRIWQWTGAFTLSEIALTGIKGGRVSQTVPEIALTEAVEIIPTSEAAEKCLRSIAAHQV